MALFDPTLDAAARADLARRQGVRYLVVDARHSPVSLQQRLTAGSIGVMRSGPLLRYQLY